ncbi:hypothetical protein [Gemmobacter sp.]|uniref:ribbon-helix-helix domain-containing protein n=1 Tax=Gemmobacter sp. TaxID=1898957 RepID=UPI002AFFC941|nr:hypothetical protein [Gemmobacter sp.]
MAGKISISITDEHAALLQEAVGSGAYASSSEVVRETASEPPSPGGGAQPLPHNPRKQRKNPAVAGSGGRFREGKWRRARA